MIKLILLPPTHSLMFNQKKINICPYELVDVHNTHTHSLHIPLLLAYAPATLFYFERGKHTMKKGLQLNRRKQQKSSHAYSQYARHFVAAVANQLMHSTEKYEAPTLSKQQQHQSAATEIVLKIGLSYFQQEEDPPPSNVHTQLYSNIIVCYTI